MGYIFVLRHGPTDGHENLNKKKYFKLIPSITQHITRYCGPDKIQSIYTSPLDRCKDTADILAELLKIKNVKKEKYLHRWNGRHNDETREEANNRVKKFGKHIRKHDNKENIILITHSSVYRSLVESLYGHKVRHQKINKGALSIIDLDTGKLKEYNLRH